MVNERDAFENVLRGSREPSIKTNSEYEYRWFFIDAYEVDGNRIHRSPRIDTVLRTTPKTRNPESMNSASIQPTVEDPVTKHQENGYISVAASHTGS